MQQYVPTSTYFVANEYINVPHTFPEIFKQGTSLPYSDIEVDYTDFVKKNPVLNMILTTSPCLTWIIDMRSLQYTYMSNNVKNMTGYEAQQFMDTGIAFFNDITHPEDRPKVGKLVKLIWGFLLSLPPHKRKSYKFNADYRLRKTDGSYIRMLEQTTILQQDSQGNVTHILGVGSDITNWKRNETMIGSVISAEDNSCYFCTPDEDELKAQIVLSKREREIVRLIAQGFNSKAIADKLSISFHTVNTHRQKIMVKTKVQNTSDLVHLAIRRGWI